MSLLFKIGVDKFQMVFAHKRAQFQIRPVIAFILWTKFKTLLVSQYYRDKSNVSLCLFAFNTHTVLEDCCQQCQKPRLNV